MLSVATLAFTVSSCGNATSSNAAANNANKNTAIVVNNNQTAKITPASNMTSANDVKTSANVNKTSTAATPASDSKNEKVSGELQVGKAESVILYVGEETGDYAAYCFTNDSEAGRAVLAACKDKERCEVMATLGEGTCKVPGLEATLSASFKISKVASAKSLGRRK